MSNGILTSALIALAWGGLTEGCRTAPEPAQLNEIQGMITTMEAAQLTLNELDADRFDRLDQLHTEQQDAFMQRFDDTLDREGAKLLADHYLVLRDAASMAEAHRRVQQEVAGTVDRLKDLHTDLKAGALSPKEGGTMIASEREQVEALEENVHRTISNYRTAQRIWDGLQEVDSALRSNNVAVNDQNP